MSRVIPSAFTKEVFRPIIVGTLDALRQRQLLETDHAALKRLLLIHEQCAIAMRQQQTVSLHHAAETVVQNGIQALASRNTLGADLLDLYYLQGYTIQAIRNNRRYKESVATLRRRRIEAVVQLADLLYLEEVAVRQSALEAVADQLPLLNYDRIFGRNADIATISEKLCDSDSFWLQNLTGMGGLGKSAVVHATMRQLVASQRVLHFVWIDIELDVRSAELLWHSIITQLARALPTVASNGVPYQQLERQVRQTLKAIPYLIVIDNVEAFDDTGELSQRLYALTNPTRFLLISRQEIAATQPIWRYRLQPISPLAAESFVRHRAEQLGIVSLIAAEDTILKRIYALVSGHPQALKLFIQLCGYFDVAAVLEEFETAQTADLEALYNDIFQRILDKQEHQTRQLLAMMRLAPAVGLPLDLIKVYSGMEKRDYWAGLKTLSRISFVEKQKLNGKTLHYVHSLTNCFLANHQQSSEEKTAWVDSIMRGCLYWQAQIVDMQPETFAANHLFLARLIRIGLSHTETWEISSEIALALFFLAENGSYWREWLAIYQLALQESTPRNAPLLLKLHSRAANLLHMANRYDEALQHEHHALTVAEQLNDIKALGRHHVHLCITHRYLHNFERAQMHGETALDIFEELKLPNTFSVVALNSLGQAAYYRGDFVKADGYYRRAAELHENVPDSMLSRLYSNWADTLRALHQSAEALKKGQQSVRYANASKGKTDFLLSQFLLCECYLDQADLHAAYQIINSAEFDYTSLSIAPEIAAHIAKTTGRYYLLQGQPVQAIQHLEAALVRFDNIAHLVSVAETKVLLAHAYQLLSEEAMANQLRQSVQHALVTQKSESWMRLFVKRGVLEEDKLRLQPRQSEIATAVRA